MTLDVYEYRFVGESLVVESDKPWALVTTGPLPWWALPLEGESVDVVMVDADWMETKAAELEKAARDLEIACKEATRKETRSFLADVARAARARARAPERPWLIRVLAART